MAGQHQIWQHVITTGVTKVFSGDGYDRNLNGKRGQETSFAQPSGLSFTPDMKGLYVADSESSSVRQVDLAIGGSSLLAGGDPMFADNLFQGVPDPQEAEGSQRNPEGQEGEGNLEGQEGEEREMQKTPEHQEEKEYPGTQEREAEQSIPAEYQKEKEEGSQRNPEGKEGEGREMQKIPEHQEEKEVQKVLGDQEGEDALEFLKFGDRDGTGTGAQFQHPLGVLYNSDGLVYVADSYNHKIKTMDPSSRTVRTVAGTGKAGFKDGTGSRCQLSEPGGLALGLDGKIFVADTNNSIIRMLNTKQKDGQSISTLELKGVEPPQLKSAEKPRRLRRRLSNDTDLIKIGPIKAMNGNIKLRISLPPGFHFTKEITSKFEANDEPDGKVVLQPASGAFDASWQALIKFSQPQDVMATVQINCKVYYCEEDEVCLYKALAFEIPFDEVSSSLSLDLPLTYDVKPPERKQTL
ncbi:hypothetical protein L7F22_016439 [Adiantum nelumboides]|nr:hypothetical protein [Adiantum nelumboides]